ncbi:MAG TPA: hypothetical protein VGA16_04490 [Candidatus Limnocylindria bacterium]
MRKLVLAFVLALPLSGAMSSAAAALPDAACNDGTMNAHSSVPGTTGTGAMVPAHEAIPESEDGSCGHGD